MSGEYISGEFLTDDDVDAYDRGELVAWRVGPDGVQWYKRTTRPDIHGVPGDDATEFEDSYPSDSLVTDAWPSDDHPGPDYPAADSPAFFGEDDDDDLDG